MFQDNLTQQIAAFLTGIGLEIMPVMIDEKTFLPGISIKNGAILVDESKLLFPGDLLHEAGHLAVAPQKFRGLLSDEVELADFNMDTIETAAMLWSYAAALHLKIDPHIVFHDGGYRQKAGSILFNYSLGVYLGIDVLQDAKMAVSGKEAADLKIEPFPKMISWLQD